MKKLIALTLSLAIILCFSLTSMATVVTFETVSVDGKTMTTTFDDVEKTFETTVTGVTDQATLLVFKGENLTTSDLIEYIDQITVGDTTKFTYKLKTDPNSTDGFSYTIKVGGSNLTNPLSQLVTPIAKAAAGYTISGTVDSAKLTPFIAEVFEDLENLPAQQALADSLNATNTTSVKLVSFADLHLFVKYILGVRSNDDTVAIKNTTVDFTAGTFALTGVSNGDYALIIQRNGFIPRMVKVTVASADVPFLYDKSLIAGDVEGSIDFSVSGLDTDTVRNSTAGFSNSWFNPKLDLNADAAITGIDTELVLANANFNHKTYGEDESIDIDVLSE